LLGATQTADDASMTETFTNAARVHTALTAAYEKRLLLRLARHTPAHISSDHLTALALVAQLAAGAAYAMASHDPRALWLVNLLIALNWLGDSLDGTLARVRNQQRPRYGFYVDHVVDILGALALIAGLGLSGFVHWSIAIAMLLCFYILSIESFLATYTLGQFHISHGLFGPTEIRILLIVGNIALATQHKYVEIAGGHFLLFDFGGAIAIFGMAIMTFVTVTRHTVTLYRAEPLT
jgi:phosphatidylglycerophosphate synthase